MISSKDAILSMAQTLIRRRATSEAVEREVIADVVDKCIELLGETIGEEERLLLIDELETRIVIKVGKPTRIVDERGHVPWYVGDRKKSRRFSQRYLQFLREDQGWSQSVIDGLDEATDAIMEELEDPEREGPWDRRGLVVGHVQFGKTANYAGLINKAADAGYKLIIVLAGMHKVLRQQTQRRLDRDFLGYDTAITKSTQTRVRIGVSEYDRSIHADYLTTQAPNGDFSRSVADNMGMGVQQIPVLLVIKKNASILKNLNNWVKEILEVRGDTKSRPLLVIDDEADQASVDTNQQEFNEEDIPDPDYEPKKINGQIRQLLTAFSRSAYVAYTATPFANILIHDAAIADDYGYDLFPRSFIFNLPAPSNYIGPTKIFGLSEGSEEEQDPLPLIRYVDQADEGWIVEGHRKDFVPRYNGEERIPPSLERAILSFILVCATRSTRGQGQKHNSMLIHVTRWTDVHLRIYGQVENMISEVRRSLRYGSDDNNLVEMLYSIWESDFKPTSKEVRQLEIGHGIAETKWDEVKKYLPQAIEKIKVQVVNSDMKDAIDYNANEEKGLSIIAIGGDKLSRGLTLEGLSVSYFLRPSRMYDSLMQMGRWFGYRPGYIDLCRLFLTPDLENWFRHVADAAEELRSRLDHMAMIGATPESYGLRIQSHEILMVTAQNKMRHSREFQVSFQGDAKIQTVYFLDEKRNRQNADTVCEFIKNLGLEAVSSSPFIRPGSSKNKWKNVKLWRDVAGAEVASFISSMKMPEVRSVNSDRISSYIRMQLGYGELTSWTVAVMSGDGPVKEHSGINFNTVVRARIDKNRECDFYRIKTALSPEDEAIDLNADEYARAVSLSNKRRLEHGKPEDDTPGGQEIRRVRGENPKRGLLLLYPISPESAGLKFEFPVMGIVVSFPETENGHTLRYRFNTVEERYTLI